MISPLDINTHTLPPGTLQLEYVISNNKYLHIFVSINITIQLVISHACKSWMGAIFLGYSDLYVQCKSVEIPVGCVY